MSADRLLLPLGNIPLIIPLFCARLSCISPRRAALFSSASHSLTLTHTHRSSGWDRVALGSVLKGQRHAHSHTRTQRQEAQRHVRDVTARPRNSLTAQTGTESPELPVPEPPPPPDRCTHLYRFLSVFNPTGRLVTGCWTR